MDRRELLLRSAMGAVAGFTPQPHPPARSQRSDRLDQGPFSIAQDEGWQTVLFTTPSARHVRNPGLGLVGYTWEENGPALAVRDGRESLADSIEQLAGLPFVDVLYVRCDWRDVQTRPGRLDMRPVWDLTLDAARRHGLRVAFRIQMSTPERQPEQLALPDFVRDQVPLVAIGGIPHKPGAKYREPRYDHPAFQKAWAELDHLLAERFDGSPLLEWVDLMQYGFWGEGHTSRWPHPFPDDSTARRTFLNMTRQQLDTWKRTPLAVNTQPDISRAGNNGVIAEAMHAGAWLRSDSILVEEPEQIDRIVSRPAHLAAVLEDGYFRHYDTAGLSTDSAGVPVLENYMLHTLDLRANYWSLWTEAANLRKYNEKYPHGFQQLQARLGYRLRPAWVWQRKRDGKPEIIVAVANQGVSGVPGTLHLMLETPDGALLRLRGTLDPGEPAGGSVRLAAFRLPQYVPEVRLRAALELRPGNVRAVEFCCEQQLNSDGSITIPLKGSNDKGWRKGV